MTEDDICCRFLISGRVQGVFFRESTARQARQRGIRGHAINLRDGRVEVLACGSSSQLVELERWLWQGPPMADVTGVEKGKVESDPPADFTIGWR